MPIFLTKSKLFISDSTMPPKTKKQKELVQDERFQAVVLSDSFETRFMPLTALKPRCLLPLANVPLIEYTLEFLAQSDVNEVFLLCSSHADQIQEYIEKSKWSLKSSPFIVTTIVGPDLRSVGDAMRDLDSRGLITGDFILVSGDVVTNIDFEKAMAFHKSRKQQDKDHILTMILSPASPLHRTRSPIDPATFVLDKKTNRCIYYSNIPQVDGEKSSINIDPELLEDVEDEFVLRNDLIDCRIDICTPHVPQIFQDDFDYQSLRSDFVRGVLSSDLLKKTIYSYVLEEGSEYASRVESWATYDAVSQDILGRWCYPLTPDSNLLGNTNYTHESNNIYKEDKVILAQSCKIGSCTSIGSNASVGDGSYIKKSVIGRNVKIGKNVKITNSYIWDDAVIEDNSVVNYAIISNNAHISKNVTLNAGTVVSFNVKIGQNVEIPPNTRIVENKITNVSEFLGFESQDTTNDVEEPEQEEVNIVGVDGIGHLYLSEVDSDEDSDSEDFGNQYSGMLYQFKSLNVSDDSISSITDQKVKKHNRLHKGRRLSTSSAVSTDYEYTDDDDDQEDFNQEAVATVERSLDNNHDLDTALLELNTLRMSMNVSYHEVRLATTQALLKKVVSYVTTDTLSAKDATTKIFTNWGRMYARQLFDVEDRTDLLNILQQQATLLDQSYNQVILVCVIRILYDMDILEEDQILSWWEETEATELDDNVKLARKGTALFITWLKEAESEDESDDE